MSPIHAPNTLDSQDTPQTSFRHPTGTNKTPLLDTSLAQGEKEDGSRGHPPETSNFSYMDIQ